LVVIAPRVQDEISESPLNSRRCRGSSEELGGGTPRVQDETSDVVSLRIVPNISLDKLAWDEISPEGHPHTPCAIWIWREGGSEWITRWTRDSAREHTRSRRTDDDIQPRGGKPTIVSRNVPFRFDRL